MNQVPIQIKGIEDDIFASFVSRFLAGGIDTSLYVIFYYIFNSILGLNGIENVSTLLFWFFLGFINEVMLMKFIGASIGKLIMQIKVIKISGTNIGFKESFLRYSITFTMDLTSIFIAIYNTFFFINSAIFMLNRTISIVNPMWNISEYITLLTNKRKRAIHDYIGGTVVIKKKYHNEIINFINLPNNL